MVGAISYGLNNRKEVEEIIKYSSALSSLMITDYDKDNFLKQLEEMKNMIEIERLKA